MAVAASAAVGVALVSFDGQYEAIGYGYIPKQALRRQNT